MNKKQYTVWVWQSMFCKGNYFRVGIIYNKQRGVKEDIIRLQFVSPDPNHCWDVQMRVDEAMNVMTGLSKTLLYLIWGKKRQNELFVQSAKMNLRKIKEG